MTSPAPLVPLNDGKLLPRVGMGLGNVPNDETADIAQAGIEVGYRLLDTAAAYRNEEGVGEALARGIVPRSELFVSTKVSKADHGYDEALRAFDDSLARLRTDYVDLYLIHFPVPNLDRYVDTWRALIRLRDEGRARSIGVANFSGDQLRRLIDETGVTPSVNQIEIHPVYQERHLVDLDRELGIVTEAWSPLGYGTAVNDPIIRDIAVKHGRTPAQAILRWHIQNDVVVIPKTVSRHRMVENMGLFDFELDADDMARIRAMDDPYGRTGPNPDTFGDPGYSKPPPRTPEGLAARKAAALAAGRLEID